ncbi:MAG: hypothetical protein FWE11_05945 [Defluviitaleaceae bacterium]|nr:hypothetical protein [Defluviitaleaceae bacterium]
MKIRHSDLIQIYQMLVCALFKNEVLQNEVTLLHDLYWTPAVGERHDLYNNPELTIGSIAHDLERISQCIDDKEPVLQHFRYLGNVLIAIADTIQHRNNQGESIVLSDSCS